MFVSATICIICLTPLSFAFSISLLVFALSIAVFAFITSLFILFIASSFSSLVEFLSVLIFLICSFAVSSTTFLASVFAFDSGFMSLIFVKASFLAFSTSLFVLAWTIPNIPFLVSSLTLSIAVCFSDSVVLLLSLIALIWFFLASSRAFFASSFILISGFTLWIAATPSFFAFWTSLFVFALSIFALAFFATSLAFSTAVFFSSVVESLASFIIWLCFANSSSILFFAISLALFSGLTALSISPFTFCFIVSIKSSIVEESIWLKPLFNAVSTFLTAVFFSSSVRVESELILVLAFSA